MAQCGLPELPVLLHFGRKSVSVPVPVPVPYDAKLTTQEESADASTVTRRSVVIRERKLDGAKRRKLKRASVTACDMQPCDEASKWSANASRQVAMPHEAQKHLESLSQVYRSAFTFDSDSRKLCSVALGESINSTASATNYVTDNIEHGTPTQCDSEKTQPESCCEAVTETDSELTVKVEPEQDSERAECDCDQCRALYAVSNGELRCECECECESEWGAELAKGRVLPGSAFVAVSRANDTCPEIGCASQIRPSSAFSDVKSADGHDCSATHSHSARENCDSVTSHSQERRDSVPRRTLAERRSQLKQLQRQRNNLHAYLRAFLSDEQIEFMENTAPQTKRRTVNRPSYGWSWDTLRRMTKLFSEMGQHGYVYLKSVVGLPLPHTTELRRLRTGYQLGAIPDDDQRPAASQVKGSPTSSAAQPNIGTFPVQPCLAAIQISGGLPVSNASAASRDVDREFTSRARWTRRRANIEPANRGRVPKWTRTNRATPNRHSARADLDSSRTSTPVRHNTISESNESTRVSSSPASNCSAPQATPQCERPVASEKECPVAVLTPPKAVETDKSRKECGLVGFSVANNGPQTSKRRASNVNAKTPPTSSSKRSHCVTSNAHTEDDALQLQPIRVDQLTLNVQQLFAVDD